MSKTSYPLKLPNSVKVAAQRLAREDGVSLNQWISSAVAEKVGAAFGMNLMDSSNREAIAREGFAQGQAEAARIGAFCG